MPPKRPVDVTQAEYGEAREPAGYPGSKRTFRIAQQLNTSSARILDRAPHRASVHADARPLGGREAHPPA